uniref:Uncharacterized protein n=1 Tax=Escherichia coli TaxID=562 RepID=A0A2R4KL75_ECOLX|nr:Hypothetical protein [Escherichia coli]
MGLFLSLKKSRYGSGKKSMVVTSGSNQRALSSRKKGLMSLPP